MQTARITSLGMNAPEVMEISGRFDGGNAEDIMCDAKMHMHMGARKLVMNCAELNYMTAGGMHALAELAKEMRERGGILTVCNMKGQPKAMFDACGFDQIISAYDNPIQAAAAIAA